MGILQQNRRRWQKRIDMDTLALESPDTWNRRSPEELKEAFEKHGITSDTTVILYGKFLFPNNADPFPGSAAGHIGAIRCAFIMMYAGVKVSGYSMAVFSHGLMRDTK